MPFIGCPREPRTSGCSPACELTLCDISSDAEVQPACAAAPWVSGPQASASLEIEKEQRDGAWLIIISVQQENTTGRLPPFSQHTTPQARDCVTDLQSCSNLSIAFVLFVLFRLRGLVGVSRGITVTGKCFTLLFFCSCLPVQLREGLWRTRFIPVPAQIYIFFHLELDIFSAPCQNTAVSSCVCVHWNYSPVPEGLSGLFSCVCPSPVYCAAHWMQNHYTTWYISRRATRLGWQQLSLSSYLPLMLSALFLFHSDHHLLSSTVSPFHRHKYGHFSFFLVCKNILEF